MAGARTQICRWRLATLKCRKEFQSVRKGNRCATRAFVLEGRPRPTGAAKGEQARFGFTVTRAMGGAVERVQMSHARQDFDYVVVARRPALDVNFAELARELATALARVHRPRTAGKPPP